MKIMKLLNLQMIPWCFHFLANPISCMQLQHHPDSTVKTIKLIKSDGLVKIYDRPIHVSELMMEFPKHLVCRSDSFYIGQKIPALPENEQLQLGHKYFLLPKHCFQSVLSFVSIATFAASSKDSRNAFLKKAASCQPFDIQKSPSGCPRIRVSDEFISQLMEAGNDIRQDDDGEQDQDVSSSSKSSKSKSKVCTTPQLQKDYTLLVGLRRWKPKLETIKEKEKRKLSSFGMKRRKKLSQQKIQKSTISDHHLLHVTKPPSKTSLKIKIKSRK